MHDDNRDASAKSTDRKQSGQNLQGMATGESPMHNLQQNRAKGFTPTTHGTTTRGETQAIFIQKEKGTFHLHNKYNTRETQQMSDSRLRRREQRQIHNVSTFLSQTPGSQDHHSRRRRTTTMQPVWYVHKGREKAPEITSVPERKTETETRKITRHTA